MDEIPSARTFWDREVVVPSHTSWMEHPRIREYILRSVSGSDQMLWPIDWFETWLNGRKFDRALSIGCGSGALERDLVRRNLVRRIEGLDGSSNSLRVARAAAAAEGMSKRIGYFAADFNEPVLPRRTFDAVFIHQALHHVAKLEKLLRVVMRALKPDGVLYLDEYIGPSRHDWTEEQLVRHRQLFESLPLEVRRFPRLNPPIQDDDPSEAIRSAEIMTQLRIGFDVLALRPYGGNLLAVLYPYAEPERIDPRTIERWIDEERDLLRTGAPPFYAVVVAEPKQGMAGRIASSRYFVEPKVKRIGREIRGRRG